MMTLPFNIPIEALYAGLAGTVLAMFIAMWQQNWRLSVFFLLALRLAIGWHFLFEGLHKIHSVYVGPNDTTKVFTSEPYFKVAPGVLGPYMRQQFENPQAVFAERVKAPKEIKPDAFRKLSIEDQAKECPESVAKALDEVEDLTVKAIESSAARALADAGKAATEAREKAKGDDAKIKAIDERLAAAGAENQKVIANARTYAKEAITAAKAEYARWVYGVDSRETEVKAFSREKPKFTAPERLEWIEMLQRQVNEADARARAGLGNGYGYEKDRAAAVRLDLLAAESLLAKDADAFVAELRKKLTDDKAEPEAARTYNGPLMDRVTRWFLVAVGAGLLLGFLSRLWCVLGAGFLIVTYLNHPAFPWYPQPPGTEGNPLFINKNIIECLALLSLACLPTGRWMGLDALFLGVPRDPSLATPPPTTQPRSVQR